MAQISQSRSSTSRNNRGPNGGLAQTRIFHKRARRKACRDQNFTKTLPKLYQIGPFFRLVDIFARSMARTDVRYVTAKTGYVLQVNLHSGSKMPLRRSSYVFWNRHSTNMPACRMRIADCGILKPQAEPYADNVPNLFHDTF